MWTFFLYILITPRGLLKLIILGVNITVIFPLAPSLMPSISHTDKQNKDFTSTALPLFYLAKHIHIITF